MEFKIENEQVLEIKVTEQVSVYTSDKKDEEQGSTVLALIAG